MGLIEMYTLQIRLVQFKYKRKRKTYLNVRIELSFNENNLNGHKYK